MSSVEPATVSVEVPASLHDRAVRLMGGDHAAVARLVVRGLCVEVEMLEADPRRASPGFIHNEGREPTWQQT